MTYLRNGYRTLCYMLYPVMHSAIFLHVIIDHCQCASIFICSVFCYSCPRLSYAEAAYHTKFSPSEKHLTCKNSPEPNILFLASSTGIREYKSRANILILQLRLKNPPIWALQVYYVQIFSDDQVYRKKQICFACDLTAVSERKEWFSAVFRGLNQALYQIIKQIQDVDSVFTTLQSCILVAGLSLREVSFALLWHVHTSSLLFTQANSYSPQE